MALATFPACALLPEPAEVPEFANGFEPVYGPADSAQVIRTGPARFVEQTRGFVERADTLFVVEYLRGLHVIAAADSAAAAPLAFVRVPGCTSVTLAGDDLLYVSNYTDLVGLRIGPDLEATVVSRTPEAAAGPDPFPPDYVGPFTCIDPARGVLAGWRSGVIERPDCYTGTF